MRILQMGRYDYDELKGGVQQYAELLAKHMDPRVHIDQLVSSIHWKTRVIKTPARTKVVVGSLGFISSVPFTPTLLFWARKLLKENDYDFLHLNFPDPLGLLVVLLLRPKVKIVVTWHSDIVRQKTLLKFYQPLVKFFMRHFVDIVLVATEKHMESCHQLKECRVNPRIHVIPFGIETERFLMTPEIQEKVSAIREKYASQFVLMTFGRHVYYKGFEYLIDAMRGLSGCILLLGGKGPLTQQLKEKAKGLPVEFLGIVSESDLPAYLHACDLFCFPSVDIAEAYGYAQIEAMACAKPVLGTWLGNGVNDVNLDGVTGITVQKKNAKALHAAILKLKEDSSLLAKLGRQAHERAWTTYSARNTASQTLTLFTQF